MGRPRLRTVLVAVGGLLLLAALALPWLPGAYWRFRSSNPVRRGTVLARELGCFSCHGPSGDAGIPVPGSAEPVPEWSGGVWMMYVKGDDDIRRIIREGSAGVEGARSEKNQDPESGAGADSRPRIAMPAYEAVVSPGELEDLVAAFKVLSGMIKPEPGSPARAGQALAGKLGCLSCHGPAGSGGLPNPGSFTGFIPGWYGPDFQDLVRDRSEFDAWIRDGAIPRLSGHPVAGYFLRRQRIRMPAYRELAEGDLDVLWAYAGWLAASDGGHRGEPAPW